MEFKLIELPSLLQYLQSKLVQSSQTMSVEADNHAIFLNVVSRVMLKETASDLAIAAAICSRHVFLL
ncbi:hypothetical protein RchiOBHm_Chr2g0141081 [Rosa chinensis]|uniref:Uncharacterized protein n=1 Tax=Rosa chinensis TaxID=74649 RepID=A0A2P6RXI6_ROSCH|nr:hypothetical protein RchiOBHm_Chr2g0141081 [Rosa chinensis]